MTATERSSKGLCRSAREQNRCRSWESGYVMSAEDLLTFRLKLQEEIPPRLNLIPRSLSLPENLVLQDTQCTCTCKGSPFVGCGRRCSLQYGHRV